MTGPMTGSMTGPMTGRSVRSPAGAVPAPRDGEGAWRLALPLVLLLSAAVRLFRLAQALQPGERLWLVRVHGYRGAVPPAAELFPAEAPCVRPAAELDAALVEATLLIAEPGC